MRFSETLREFMVMKRMKTNFQSQPEGGGDSNYERTGTCQDVCHFEPENLKCHSLFAYAYLKLSV